VLVISIKIVVAFVFTYCWIVSFGLLAMTFVFVSTTKTNSFYVTIKEKYNIFIKN